MRVPSVPPSVNNAYITVHNKRVLTKAGREYKTETKTFIARTYPSLLKFFSKEHEYAVLIRVTFKGKEALFTKGFETGKAESRYKKVDVTNRIKLLEDALAEATGIEDQQNFVFASVKDWSETEEFTDVWVWKRGEESNPVDAFIHTFVVAEPHRALPAQPPRWA
jgi:hypothetical protein